METISPLDKEDLSENNLIIVLLHFSSKRTEKQTNKRTRKISKTNYRKMSLMTRFVLRLQFQNQWQCCQQMHCRCPISQLIKHILHQTWPQMRRPLRKTRMVLEIFNYSHQNILQQQSSRSEVWLTMPVFISAYLFTCLIVISLI